MSRSHTNGVFTRFLMNGASSLAFLASSGAAFAQSEESGGIQDIIVTAQKTEENLQDVPLAVTAVGVEQLENLQVNNLNNVAGLAPNLTVRHSTSGSDPIFTLRGIIGANAPNGTDSAVAMYVDGVYLARTTGASFEVADIERVEVLRGPQGTLYGRSSTGGAINFITAKPKDEFYARLEGTVGNFDRRKVRLRVDTGNLGGISFTGAYLHDEADGWTRNLNGGLTWDFSAANRFMPGTRRSVDTLGGFNTDAGFFAAHYESDSVQIDYKFDITSSDRTNYGQQVIVDYTTAVPPALVSLTELPAIAMPMTTPEQLRTFGHSLTINAELADGLTLKSITGYRSSKDTYTNDVAGSGGAIPGAGAFAFTNILAYEKNTGFQQEVQLNYVSNSFDVIAGVNYFHERTTSTAPVYIFQFVPFTVPSRTAYPPTIDGDVTSSNKSFGVFAQATFHVTEQLDITGGIRYTHDRREADESGSFLGVVRSDFAASFNNTDWSANITFRPTDDVTLYAKAGSGYLAGGAFAGIGFEPERVIQYEAGAKVDFFDRRARLNLAAFHTDYSNLQIAGFFVPPGGTTAVYHIRNVTDANIDGFEAEFTLVPVDGLTLSGNYGYTNFKYLTLPPGIVNPSYRPRHTAALNLNYKFPDLGGIKPVLDINATYVGDQFLLPGDGSGGVPYAANPGLFNAISDNGGWEVDARFTLADISLGGIQAKLSFWTKNLFNQHDIVNMVDATGGFVVNGQFRKPRTYGLDLGFEF